LDKKNKEGLFKKGDILAMSAFGGGLTTGAWVIRWNK
jgi:3-oxoacyl-[acyl-carrier-protein] synthase-3